MQLIRFSDRLKPLTLATGLFAATSALAYSDLDSFTGILSVTTNDITSEYIKCVDKSDNVYFLQKFRFQNHLLNWEQKTLFFSSIKHILEDDDFKAIVSMGQTAVPFIIEEIEAKPSILVWSLNLIFNRKVSNDSNVTISEACKLWVRQLKK